MQQTIIRPGLLVSLKTTIRGGVSYQQTELEADHIEETGARVARWETRREIIDAAEHDAAIVARGKARTAIVRQCCASSFGLLCPVGRETELAAAIEEAQRIADDFNRAATHSRIEVYVIAGRIADNDQAAARAIGSEVRDLIESMERGIRAADPAAIREAANKARAVAGMLSESAQIKVSAAIEDARRIARDIVRRVEKAGERAADVVDGCNLERLQAARFAVLDLEPAADGADQAADQAAPTPAPMPALDLAPVALELAPTADVADQAPAAARLALVHPAFELEGI